MTSILWAIPAAVVLTATVSGIFGMAGGMILMGFYATVLPVPAAMVLHGVTQLASNGARCWLLREHILWSALAPYFAGALLALTGCGLAAVVVDKSVLLIALGGIPLLATLIPRSAGLRFESRPVGFACGVVVTAAQLVAGVSGPLLDIFFVKGDLDRHQVIATKAITQAFGHTLKLVYYGALVGHGLPDELPLWIYPVAVVCAFGGTAMGKRVLARLTDLQFRRYSTWIVGGLALVFLVRGLTGVLGA